MIIYQGLKLQDNLHNWLCFANEAGEKIQIPIDQITAQRIGQYLALLAEPYYPQPEVFEVRPEPIPD